MLHYAYSRKMPVQVSQCRLAAGTMGQNPTSATTPADISFCLQCCVAEAGLTGYDGTWLKDCHQSC
jgi:hypothetical protein